MSQAKEVYPRQYYPYLDGFRAVSILWVILHHVFVYFDPLAWAKLFLIPGLLFAKLGLLGVDMFFVISGFLITGLLIQDLDGDIRIKRFYGRRIFKIVPQYLLAVCVGTLMLLAVQKVPIYLFDIKNFANGEILLMRTPANLQLNPWHLASYLIFIQNYTQQILTLEHTWSIAIEEHFYLIYPLLLFLITRIAKGFRNRRMILVMALTILIVSIHLFRYYCICILKIAPFQTTLFRIDALMFGCLLRIYEPWILALPQQCLKFLSKLSLILGVFLYALIFCLKYIYYASGNFSQLMTVFLFTAYYAAPGFIMLSALMGSRMIRSFTSNKVLIWIGKNSYGTYLWHYILIFAFVPLLTILPAMLVIPLYVLSSLLIGYISTITIERYFLNLRNKYVP